MNVIFKFKLRFLRFISFIFSFQCSHGVLHPPLTGDLPVFYVSWVVLSCSVFVPENLKTPKIFKTLKNLKTQFF